MKKIFSTPAMLCIFCLTSFAINAQSKTNRQYSTDPKILLTAVKLSNPFVYESAGAASEFSINTKAIRNFKKTFRNVADEKWYVLSNGYVVQYTADSIKNIVVYDKKGNNAFSIAYYGEKQLDPEVRSIVKTTYYDYLITKVEEIHAEGKTIYLVHMQDENTWKNVRVCDGEMELLDNFNKK